MSRGPYASLNMRWGARMGDTKMIDMVVGALHDPFHTIHMGVTAENVAAKYGITREMQDALAVESHNRAQRATAAGYFKEQIVPVTLKSKKGEVAWATDEHFRPDCKLEDMAKLKPVFVKENGTVTAGNASGINDAAAAVVLMEAGAAKARGAKPLARLVAYAHTGLDPKIMGVGPISATQAVLKKTGLTVNDLDVIEANEAFAAQALAVMRSLGLDLRRRLQQFAGRAVSRRVLRHTGAQGSDLHFRRGQHPAHLLVSQAARTQGGHAGRRGHGGRGGGGGPRTRRPDGDHPDQ